MWVIAIDRLLQGEQSSILEKELAGGWINYRVRLFRWRLIISLLHASEREQGDGETRTLDKLGHRGMKLVELQLDQSDHRRRVVQINAAGEAVVNSMLAALV
jgi:hypothetical protein